MTGEEKACIDLINAWSELCPTQYDRDAVRGLVAEMRVANENHKAIAKAICSRLLDGLNHGNWPSEVDQLEQFNEQTKKA